MRTKQNRREFLRTAAACFGHRLMMDRVVPGGVIKPDEYLSTTSLYRPE